MKMSIKSIAAAVLLLLQVISEVDERKINKKYCI